MIVVTGVTGNLGRVVVEDLLTRVPADQLAAVARTPEKAADLTGRGVDVRAGDYDDPASLEAAFAGADVVLLVSSPDVTPGTRARQHGNAITAAKAAGVGRIVYTSAIKADSGPGFLTDHAATEQLLRESGLTSTVLRNSFYSDFFVNPGVVKAAVEAGEVVSADGGKALNTATIRDFGLAASAVLTGSDHDDACHELRGPLWTYDDLAAVIAEESGTTVVHREIPLAEAGEGAFIAQLVSDGFFAEPSDALERLLGRPATGIRELVRAALA
ncbi:MAG TPA: NAD(P)H-binding protein [Pseudonocardia sp.]|jgi:NAD(P)H dehydrogenase (quinone)|nr:NAD(P)H-binding protein [Pseudonocardia sp.]